MPGGLTRAVRVSIYAVAMSAQSFGPGPVENALEELRTFAVSDYATEDAANTELDHRMRTLRLALAATDEILKRDEEPTPDSIREEMVNIGTEFAFDPLLLKIAAEEARELGETDDAALLERAYQWLAANGPRRTGSV